jgi:hypothetical protein
MRIDNLGRVGIGTTAPTRDLVLKSTGVTYFKITENTLGETVNDGFDLMIDSGATAYAWNRENGALAFGTNNTERARIDSSGRVGIGTTSPAYQCVVEGSTPYLQLKQAGTNTGSSRVIFGDADTASPGQIIYDHSNSSLQAVVNGTERARIDTDGRLLLGTSSDSGGALLQVNGNRVRIATAKTPASASDTGTAGEICWDSSYIYVCTATDTWKRAALSTW